MQLLSITGVNNNAENHNPEESMSSACLVTFCFHLNESGGEFGVKDHHRDIYPIDVRNNY
jgi:hypothetical protein